MNNIKHFSFDLWYTLIRSNPLFKERRAHYFYTRFNTKNKSIEEIRAIFQRVDLLCNAINEKTGKNISAAEMYLMVIFQVNESADLFNDVDMNELYTDMENLVFQYMPEVFCDQTLETLDRIKSRQGVTLNILSNTAFIKGSTLKKVNTQLGISRYVDFEIYSDEVGLSKPNIELYDHLLKKISIARPGKIGLGEIVHVGDNYLADIAGAQKAGIKAFQINTTHHSIIHLLQ